MLFINPLSASVLTAKVVIALSETFAVVTASSPILAFVTAPDPILPDVTAPDLICVLDPKTGEAITNPNCQQGMAVAVIGYPAPAMWRLPKGLEVFGPKHFDYALPYRPIEKNRRLR